MIELECGVTVYPAREEQGRWRAVWYENGKRQQCEAASEEKLAAKLEKVTERLEADAPNMSWPGADLDRALPGLPPDCQVSWRHDAVLVTPRLFRSRRSARLGRC